MKTWIFAVSMMLIASCSDSSGNRTVVQNTPTPAPPSDFRKELFAGIHREAVAFQVGQTPPPKQLQVELELVKHAMQSQAERDVYDLFEAIYFVQSDLAQLERLREATESFARQNDPEKQNATIKQLDQLGVNSDKVRHLSGALGESADAVRQGLVIVESSLTPDAAVPELVKRYSLATTQGKYGIYVGYEDTKVKMIVMMKVTLEAAGRMIFNNGRMPDDPKTTR